MLKILQKGFILLSLASLTLASCEDEEATVAPSPVISEISPEEGPVGTPVTLTGTNFDRVERVLVGGVEVEYTATATSLSTTIPAGVSPGMLQVAVYLPNGSDRRSFEVLSVPTVTEGTPEELLPGDQLVLTGTYLSDVNRVTLGEQELEFTSTPTSITANLPIDLAPGAHTLTVTSRGGAADYELTIMATPKIMSFTPADGEPETPITVSGVNFIDVQSVSLGGRAVEEYTVENVNTITFMVPAGASTGRIAVVTAAGTAQSESPFTVAGGALDTVDDPSLVFFDFDGKDSWWGDAGGVESDPDIALSGNYFRINADREGWTGLFWRNSKDNFPADVIGTNVDAYVLKFDIIVLEPLTDGVLAWSLNGTSGVFWYNITPAALQSGTGWYTISIPITDFRDGAGNAITDMSTINADFGVAFNNGTSKVNLAIDNVRFELK